jgi:hypothetical protein
MANSKNNLDSVLQNVQELEGFFHALLPALDDQKLKQGDDLLGYAKALKLKIPESLLGEAITWETGHSHSHGEHDVDAISLVRPGHSGAVGLVIKCVRIGRWRFCLECGWIWCRIVVSRRF